jgi:hypothetical protein
MERMRARKVPGASLHCCRIAGWWKQVGQPLHQQLGAEEGEHAAGARLGVQPVGEVGFYARAFPHKGQRAAPGGQGGGQAFGVAAALQFYAGERGALLLGFDDAAGFAVDVEHVVGKPKAVVQGEFANCHAGAAWMLAWATLQTCQPACCNSASMLTLAFCSGVMATPCGTASLMQKNASSPCQASMNSCFFCSIKSSIPAAPA